MADRHAQHAEEALFGVCSRPTPSGLTTLLPGPCVITVRLIKPSRPTAFASRLRRREIDHMFVVCRRRRKRQIRRLVRAQHVKIRIQRRRVVLPLSHTRPHPPRRCLQSCRTRNRLRVRHPWLCTHWNVPTANGYSSRVCSLTLHVVAVVAGRSSSRVEGPEVAAASVEEGGTLLPKPFRVGSSRPSSG